jgi:signal peptidase I
LPGKLDWEVHREMEKQTAQQPKTAKGQSAFEWYEALISAALVLVLIFSFFFRIIQVDGESMVPTLQNGEKLIVWGAGYEPQRGDVVIVDSYTPYGKPLVKRVIAKGGDTICIDYETGTVAVNGEVLQEDYIAEPTYLGYDVEFPYTVPEGTVFVMGDNRNNSLDSRSSYVGCIDERDILGKVLLCFLPVSDFGVVK